MGCGTLILIAIIVAMFSRGGDTELKVEALRRDVQQVQQSINALGQELRRRTAQPEKPVVPPDQKD